MKTSRLILILLLVLVAVLTSSCAGTSELQAPGVTLSVDPSSTDPQQVSTGVELLVLLTVLSLAPSILVLGTSFTRIVIVLSMLRSAIGTPTIPPNQVVIGLSLILTFFIMSPVYTRIDQEAIQPYLKKEITQETALAKAMEPVREFMFKQTRQKDIALFLNMNGSPAPQTTDDVPSLTLFPAFVLSELRTAFTMGFILYVPFLVIDMVISSVLLSMGMMMLPPSLVSLPFKILVFVMVDGWYLIIQSLSLSFLQ